MQTIVSAALAGWIPHKLFGEEDQVYCRWLYTGGHRFTEPFFDESENACLSLHENSQPFRSVSLLALLPDWSVEVDAVAPSAIVFHVSRCGSTLVSQLLGLKEQHIVLAEVPFFDTLLRTPFKEWAANRPDVNRLLPAAIRLYGQRRRGDESHLFIKADSWHLCFYHQLRQLYPAVPFILLYRSPDEVLRSQRRQWGMQAIPGLIEPQVFGFDQEAIAGLSLDEYMVLVLQHYFSMMLGVAATDPRVLLVNYQEPAMNMMERIAAVGAFSLTGAYRQQIAVRSRYHAKHPDQVFEEPVYTEALPASLAPVMELYQQLDHLRIKRG